MAPRSTWKGFLKLSLVSVPVKAYTASATAAEVRLNQLHKDCHNRIKYKKTCPEHGEVGNDDIVSGYEYAKGQYVVIDPDEIDKLRTKSDRAVTIDGFVGPGEIDPIYHAGKTYYLLPDGAVGQKPYALLHRGMADQNVCAIARVVIAGKEQLVELRVLDKLIAMTVLSHKNRIKSADSFTDELVDAEIGAEEMKLANTLIQASKIEDEEPKIINIMEALKKSVAEVAGGTVGSAAAGSKEEKEPASKKKMAPSKKAKKSGKKKIG
jgi:DNA end-binding protein Ku